MNARELLDDLESGLIDEFMSAEVKAIYIRALRLLAAAEENDGSIPEMTKAVQEGRGIELGCQFERERNGLAARVGELEKDAERIRYGLALFLDPMVINSENIGDIRRSLFLPLDCAWNCWVRELTAERENSPTRHPLDVQAAIDAARGSKP